MGTLSPYYLVNDPTAKTVTNAPDRFSTNGIRQPLSNAIYPAKISHQTPTRPVNTAPTSILGASFSTPVSSKLKVNLLNQFEKISDDVSKDSQGFSLRKCLHPHSRFMVLMASYFFFLFVFSASACIIRRSGSKNGNWIFIFKSSEYPFRISFNAVCFNCCSSCTTRPFILFLDCSYTDS